jgi:predicted metal-binding membrane protein
MWVRVNSQRPLMFLLAALIAVAWLALWLWGASPYGQFLGHEHVGTINLQEDQLLGVIFVVGWTLMTTAMMLPTTLPLIMLFHSFAARRPDRLQLMGLLVVGYLGIWTLFGIAVHLVHWLAYDLVARITWVQESHWLIASATLVLAGVYQFTPLKYKCLDKCRSPLSFIMEHWRGRQEQREAFLLGVHHGIFCIGCCWALMLLMFAVGIGNLAWMLALAAVMAVEKNMPWGRRLSAPLGALLIGSAVAVALTQNAFAS